MRLGHARCQCVGVKARRPKVCGQKSHAARRPSFSPLNSRLSTSFPHSYRRFHINPSEATIPSHFHPPPPSLLIMVILSSALRPSHPSYVVFLTTSPSSSFLRYQTFHSHTFTDDSTIWAFQFSFFSTVI